MSDYSDSEDETHPRRKKLTPEQRKALMATTQLTELEMVEMWNQYKFNFPTGKANTKQLLQLMKKVVWIINSFQKLKPKNSNHYIIEWNIQLFRKTCTLNSNSKSISFYSFFFLTSPKQTRERCYVQVSPLFEILGLDKGKSKVGILHFFNTKRGQTNFGSLRPFHFHKNDLVPVIRKTQFFKQ